MNNVRCTGRKPDPLPGRPNAYKLTSCATGPFRWQGLRMYWQNGEIPNLDLPCPHCGGTVERIPQGNTDG